MGVPGIRPKSAFYVVANKLNSKDIAEQLFEMGIAGEMICKY